MDGAGGGGGGFDDSVPEISTEHPLQGTVLHDTLHGRRAWSESNNFGKGVGRICPQEGLL